jgi:hypothetical protein
MQLTKLLQHISLNQLRSKIWFRTLTITLLALALSHSILYQITSSPIFAQQKDGGVSHCAIRHTPQSLPGGKATSHKEGGTASKLASRLNESLCPQGGLEFPGDALHGSLVHLADPAVIGQ